MINRRIRCLCWLIGLSVLTGSLVYSQSKTHPERATIQLTFSAMHPRANVPFAPADFLHRGILDACRSAYQELPRCFYGFDWIHFRLTAPNKIDSIRITGDYLPEWLTDFYESKILASQPFWHYADKGNNGPIVIAIPVDFALESGCAGNRPLKGKYDLESAAIDSLFADKARFLPTLRAVQRGKRQVLLWPAFLHSMR